jgi:hypothetical protein
MKVAIWAAGALAFGWLVTAASLAYPGGHPPAWFILMEGVAMISFVVAPIGAGAAAIAMWRARRQAAAMPRMAVASLSMNLLFLSVAIGVWLWIMSKTV